MRSYVPKKYCIMPRITLIHWTKQISQWVSTLIVHLISSIQRLWMTNASKQNKNEQGLHPPPPTCDASPSNGVSPTCRDQVHGILFSANQ